MSAINSVSQYNAFPTDNQNQIQTLTNEESIDISNVESNDIQSNYDNNNSPSTEFQLSPPPNFSSTSSDLFAQTQRSKLLNFVPNGKQELSNNQSLLGSKTQQAPTNFSNNKVANENMFGQMMKASIQSKPVSKIESSSPKTIPIIGITVSFPNDGKPITAERAARKLVQEYVGQNELFPDEVDKVLKLSNFSIKTGDQTVQSQIQVVNGQRSLNVSINIQDKTRLLEAKKQVLGERETVAKIFQEVRSQNEIEGASKGLLTGVYDSGKQAYDLVTSPIESTTNLLKLATSPVETTKQLKQAFGEKYNEFVAAPPARKAEMLAYLPGQAIGNILLGKGVGVIAKTTPIAKITSTAGQAIAETKLAQSAIKAASIAKDSVDTVKTVVKEETVKRLAIVLDDVVKDPRVAALGRRSPAITTIFDNKVPTTTPSTLAKIGQNAGSVADNIPSKQIINSVDNEAIEATTIQNAKIARETQAKIDALDLDLKNNGHVVGRHGPEVTLQALEQRLKTGIAPDNHVSFAPASTKFSSYEALAQTQKKALNAIEQKYNVDLTNPPLLGKPKEYKIEVGYDKPIDDGFLPDKTTKQKDRPVTDPITGITKKGDLYTSVIPIDGVTGTYTKVVWEDSKWKIVQHFPLAKNWDNVNKIYTRALDAYETLN